MVIKMTTRSVSHVLASLWSRYSLRLARARLGTWAGGLIATQFIRRAIGLRLTMVGLPDHWEGSE